MDTLRPTPSLGVYTDKQLLDELYIRMKRGAITVELVGMHGDYAHLRMGAKGRDGLYSFEVTVVAAT